MSSSRSLCRACRGGWGVHTHVVSRDVSVLVARPRHVAAQVFAAHLSARGGLDRGAPVERNAAFVPIPDSGWALADCGSEAG